jgi:hypothetical protein
MLESWWALMLLAWACLSGASLPVMITLLAVESRVQPVERGGAGSESMSQVEGAATPH